MHKKLIALAEMYAADKNALLCDLAETYGIFDLRALPVPTLAVLACGLSADSRIKRKLAGVKAPTNTLLLACAVDRLSMIAWMQSKDGARTKNRPASILKSLLREENSLAGFDSPEAFMTARAKITGG